MKQLNRILLLIGIILLVNLLSRNYFFRWDVTKDGQYTLSSATKNILTSLEEPITVTAYFSNDLPQQLVKTRDDFRDLLIEYSTRSNGLVNYEFLDPAEDPEEEQKAQQNGISPIIINVRERDESVQKRAYLGAIVQSESGQELIPLIQPEGPMEYQLTTSIKKVASVDKPSIGIIQGHGEPPLASLQLLNQSLSILYSVETVNLNQEEVIPSRFKTLLMINPTDSIADEDFLKLDNYLAGGGNICLAYNVVQGDFQTAQGSVINTQITEWLNGKGIAVEPSFVIDARCGDVQVQQRSGFFTFNTAVKFPYFPLISEFEEHPVTDGLDQIIFQFASPITYTGDSSSLFTPLTVTSEKSGKLPLPTYFDVNREWTSADFLYPNLAIGGVLHSPNSDSRMIVFTDGDFPLGGQGGGQTPDNISLISNSVDWLSDDTGLIDLRTKGVASRPIKDLEDAEKTRIKWTNFLLPIILVLLYGFFRLQRNRRIRMKRMEQRFV